MLTITSPFLHVQAIRRQFRDQGLPTIAKERHYALTVNYAGTGLNEEARQVLSTDVDSWFVWLSLYHYFENSLYDPERGQQLLNNESGQIVSATTNDITEVRLMNLSTERPMHNVDFVSRHHLDGFMFTTDSGAQDGELFQGAAHPRETGVGAIGVWRGHLVEPVLFMPRTQFQVGIRRRLVAAAQPQRGHLFLFSGVSLYVGRA